MKRFRDSPYLHLAGSHQKKNEQHHLLYRNQSLNRISPLYVIFPYGAIIINFKVSLVVEQPRVNLPVLGVISLTYIFTRFFLFLPGK